MKEREYNKYLRKCKLYDVDPRPVSADSRCVAVIPACDEFETIGKTLNSLVVPDLCSVVVVVNHPENASSRVKAASTELLRQLGEGQFSCRNLHWIFAPDLRGGVGEARKIGMDAVVGSMTPEDIEGKILASLDADTLTDPGYFSEIIGFFEQNRNAAALSIPFRHQRGANAEEEQAIRSYEAYLDRYVAKLREAGSPYAFQTVGSAFAVRLDTYVRAGGMRIRKGGEDFYFLQAVAKIGAVETGKKILVYPSARPSERVPFGTGPAVRKLMAGETLPEVSDRAFSALTHLLAEAADDANLKNSELLISKIDKLCADFLRQEKFPEVWPTVLANTPKCPEARIAAFHRWFDGLRTLRCLHYFDRSSASLPEI